MNFFDVMMTLIEDFIIAYFDFKILNINNKKLIFFLTFFCTLITFIFNNLLLDNYWLMIILIMIFTVTSSFCNQKRNLIYFIVPAILIIVLLFSNTISTILVSTVFFINPIKIASNNVYIILLSLLSRVIFLILSYLFSYYDNKYRLNKNKLLVGNYWWSFCLFVLSFLGVYTLLFEMIFYHMISSINMYKLLFQVIVMCCSFFIFYFNIQKEYQNNIIINEKLLKSKYATETYEKINKLSYQMLQEKHLMYYILISIKNYLDNDNRKEIEKLIENQLDKFDFCKLSNLTGIRIFDEEIIKYLISLEKNGFSIKKVLTINSINVLENSNFVKEIKLILKQVVEFCLDNKTFELYLYEVNEFVVLKIVVINKDKMFKFNKDYNEHIIERRIVQIKNDNIEIKVLFKIN